MNIKINGTKADLAGIKFSSRTATADPIQYEATASTTINDKYFEGSYTGDDTETRMECKEGAYWSLREACKKAGIILQ